MSRTLKNEVVELNVELEKSIADLQFLVDEFKENVQKNLDEFGKVQSFHTERIDKIEDFIKNEVNNLKQLSDDLSRKFETFKQETSNLIEQSLDSDNLKSDNGNQILGEYGRRLETLEQLQEQISQVSTMSPEKLREELISGIRMLGDRVSKAIADINERIDNFTDEVHAQVNNTNRNSYADAESAPNQENEDFASLKESKLLDENDFEVVPREAIKRLTELFKKQSAAVKKFIGENEQKIEDFERLLKNYDDENTHLLELLDRRVKRNFLISMGAIIIVILGTIAMRIF
jgi:gas vesicle protein